MFYIINKIIYLIWIIIYLIVFVFVNINYSNRLIGLFYIWSVFIYTSENNNKFTFHFIAKDVLIIKVK